MSLQHLETRGPQFFARALAHADEHEQAAFLNAFCQELRSVCRQGQGWGQQVYYFAKDLTATTGEVMKEIAENVTFHEAERRADDAKLRDVRQELRDLEQLRDALKQELVR